MTCSIVRHLRREFKLPDFECACKTAAELNPAVDRRDARIYSRNCRFTITGAGDAESEVSPELVGEPTCRISRKYPRFNPRKTLANCHWRRGHVYD